MLSIVIATKNRAGAIGPTFSAFERMAATVPWELVVVDNGSTDATAAVVAEFAARAPFPLRMLVEPRAGKSRALNTACRHASGEIVAFTDDDCYPAPDYVDAVARAFHDPALGFLGGRVLLHDPADHPITIQTRETRLDLPPGTFIDAGLIHGANMAARRAAIEHVGGFDEGLGAGTPYPGEDVDFLQRLSAAGVAGAYDPAPVVYHHHRRQAPGDVEALDRWYDIGRGACYMSSLLDPARRGLAARHWYWTVRHRLGRRPMVMADHRRTWREIRGALGYGRWRLLGGARTSLPDA